MDKILANHDYESPFPFVWAINIYGDYQVRWKPGAHYLPESGAREANGLGAVLIKTLNIASPGLRYQERIFHILQWRSPDGELMGAKTLRCSTQSPLTNLLEYCDEYTVLPAAESEKRKAALLVEANQLRAQAIRRLPQRARLRLVVGQETGETS